jgi:pimeloyl-ACP methyl ester carboxylesterase
MTLKRRGFSLGIGLVGLCLSSPAFAFDFGPHCEEVHFSVALTPGGPADQDLVGWLCARGPIVEGRTIQVLVHGGSYDHNYWDFPVHPERYSYVDAITTAGYVTLNIDRIGSGESSHPDPDGLNLHTAAFTVHQVVTALRSGALRVPNYGRIRNNRIMLVGHSLGSFISTIETSTYHDVDAVILSAYSHSTGPGAAALEATLYPAAFDPAFAADGLPLDYFTTVPGTRLGDFYYEPRADPNIVAADEALKQTATLGELLDIDPSFAASAGVTVPTLVAVGDFDSVDCLAPSCSATHSLDAEASNYGDPACVDVVDFPNAGHDLNLQTNAPAWFIYAALWSDLHVGPFGSIVPLRCRHH